MVRETAQARASLRDRVRGTAGTSPAELMVTIGITTLVLGLSVIGLNSRFTSFGSAAQSLANDLRLARVAAITRGAHYRMLIGTDWYRTERLQDANNDRVWDPDTSYPSPQRTLQGGVTMTSATGRTASTGGGSASVVEFDTRGMIVPATGGTVPSTMSVAVKGSSDPNSIHGTLTVYVWPSGQIQLLAPGEVRP